MKDLMRVYERVSDSYSTIESPGGQRAVLDWWSAVFASLVRELASGMARTWLQMVRSATVHGFDIVFDIWIELPVQALNARFYEVREWVTLPILS